MNGIPQIFSVAETPEGEWAHTAGAQEPHAPRRKIFAE